MNHVHSNEHQHHEHELNKGALSLTQYTFKDYLPLLAVLGFIGISSLIHIQLVENTITNWMSVLMGFFFIYFALFKFIDLKGFADGYKEYDLVAGRLPFWGYLYPFIELGLGSLYLLGVNKPSLHIFTIIITVVSVVGVVIKLLKKEQFMCACLGTVLKVPLTTVTLLEYGSMALMAFYLLVI